MTASGYISRRLRFSGRIAMVSVAVSFIVMIVAISVCAGFRHEIRSAVSQAAGDVRLAPHDIDYADGHDPIPASPSYMQELLAVEGVESITPVIYRAGIVKSGESIHGVMFKGTPSDTASLKVRIPSRLAGILSLSEGDRLPAYFVGERVKARNFTVGEIYEPILETDDALVVYAPIDDMRRLNGWEPGTTASVLEVTLGEDYRSPSVIEEKSAELGTVAMLSASDVDEQLVATSSVNRFARLFDWLGLLDANVVFIIVLMTVVAGFNMISGLLILLFRNISTIGILKSMGMTDRGVSAVFLKLSAGIVFKGMLAGNLTALAFCAIQSLTHLIRLNPDNYFVSFVPVSVNIPAILLSDIAAFAVIMLLLLIPCRFISRVDPAETVKAE